MPFGLKINEISRNQVDLMHKIYAFLAENGKNQCCDKGIAQTKDNFQKKNVENFGLNAFCLKAAV